MKHDEMPELKNLDNAVSLKKVLDAKKSTTIRLKTSTLYYFQLLSKETGIPYQTLINMYLDDCAQTKRKIKIDWK